MNGRGTDDQLQASAVGSFTALPVPETLRASFSAAWMHRMPADLAAPVVITPDATIDLQWIDGVLRIAGPDSAAHAEQLAPGSTVIGLRFRTAVAASWLGLSVHEIANGRPGLDDLWGRRARQLSSRTADLRDASAVLAVLAEELARLPASQERADPAMCAAFELVRNGLAPDVPLIPFLQRALHMSERTLRRRFDEHFGYGPRTLDRILRFQRFLRLSRSNRSAPMARLAAEAGYADQAHLIRESRRMTGATPLMLARMVGAEA